MNPKELVVVDPGDVYAGNIVVGEIQVRAFRDEMPASGTIVTFADRRWLVTQRNVPAEGGRSTYRAILV